MLRSGPARRQTWLLLLATQFGCLGPHAAPNPVVKGDRRYYAFEVVEALGRLVNAHRLDGLEDVLAPDVEILDAHSDTALARSRAEALAYYAKRQDDCPALRVEVLDRSYADRGRFVSDLERTLCGDKASRESWVKYEIAGKVIVRIWR